MGVPVVKSIRNERQAPLALGVPWRRAGGVRDASVLDQARVKTAYSRATGLLLSYLEASGEAAAEGSTRRMPIRLARADPLLPLHPCRRSPAEGEEGPRDPAQASRR